MRPPHRADITKVRRANVRLSLGVLLLTVCVTDHLTGSAPQSTPSARATLDIVEQPQRECCDAIAVNDEGRLLATTSGNNEVTLWDLATGLELRTLIAEVRAIPHRRDEAVASVATDTFSGLAFDPSGRYLTLTAVDARNPRTFDRPRRLAVPNVWELETGRDLSAVQWAFDANTQRIASPAFAFDPAETLFWQVTRNPAIVSKLARYDGQARAFSPDGSLGVVFASAGTANAYAYLLTAVALDSGRELWTTRTAGGSPPVVTFSPDSRWAVISARTSQRILDTRTGALVADLTSHDVGTAVAFSRDSRRLVAVGSNKARVFSVADWQSVAEMRVPEFERLLRVTFTADGGRVIAGSDDAIHVWDAASAHEIRRISMNGVRPVRGVAVSGRRWLAAGTEPNAAFSGGEVLLWPLDGEAPPRHLWDEQRVSIRSIAFSPDEQRIGVVSYAEHIGRQQLDGNITVCALPDCAERSTLLTDREEVRQRNHDVIPEAGATSLVFTNDGATIVAAVLGLSAYRPARERYREFASFPRLVFYDARTLRRRKVVDSKGADVSALAMSRDGALLATGHDQNIVRVWRTATGSQQGSFQWPLATRRDATANSITGLAFHPDGRRLAVARDGALSLLDIVRGTRTTVAVQKELRESAVRFSPDGSLLIVSGTERRFGHLAKARISAWEASTWNRKWSVEFAGKGVSQLVFDGAGKWFAAATSTGLSLHDPATGARIMTLATFAGNDWLAWTPDGRYAGTPAAIARLAAIRQGTHALPLSAVGRELTLKDLVTQVLR